MSEDHVADEPKARGAEDSAREAEPKRGLQAGQHELLLLSWIGVVFGVLMILQERNVLLMVARGEEIPSLLWRLQWPLLLVLSSLLFPVRARIVFLAVTGSLLGLVAIGDATYFRFFGSVTSLVSAGTMHQLVDVRDSVFDVMKTRDFLYPVLLLSLSSLAFLPKRWLVGRAEQVIDWRQRRLLVVRLGTLLMFFATGVWEFRLDCLVEIQLNLWLLSTLRRRNCRHLPQHRLGFSALATVQQMLDSLKSVAECRVFIKASTGFWIAAVTLRLFVYVLALRGCVCRNRRFHFDLLPFHVCCRKAQ